MQTLVDKTALSNDISLLLSKYQSGDELEIRFGYYENDYFRSSISYQLYNKLLQKFTKFTEDGEYTHAFISNTIHMYSNGIRQIKTDDSDIIIKKNKKQRIDYCDLGVRIALSNEKMLTELPNGKYMKKTRRRHTFLNKSSNYRIDLTIDTLPRSNQCQCEIEFLKKPNTNDVIEMIDMISGYLNS